MSIFAIASRILIILTIPACYAEVSIRPISSGDIVTRQYYNPTQLGSEPIEFPKKGSGSYKMQIEENGDRKFLDPEDDSLVFINNKDYVTVFTKGKPIPEDYRFVRLPIGVPLRPGMEWDVPTYQLNTWEEGNVSAKSSIGPTIHVQLDDIKTPIDTILINYEGRVQVRGGYSRRISIESLFSRQLNEFVRHQVIDWHWEGNGKTFLYRGSRYDLKSVRYKKAEPPTPDAEATPGTPE